MFVQNFIELSEFMSYRVNREKTQLKTILLSLPRAVKYFGSVSLYFTHTHCLNVVRVIRLSSCSPKLPISQTSIPH